MGQFDSHRVNKVGFLSFMNIRKQCGLKRSELLTWWIKHERENLINTTVVPLIKSLCCIHTEICAEINYNVMFMLKSNLPEMHLFMTGQCSSLTCRKRWTRSNFFFAQRCIACGAGSLTLIRRAKVKLSVNVAIIKYQKLWSCNQMFPILHHYLGKVVQLLVFRELLILWKCKLYHFYHALHSYIYSVADKLRCVSRTFEEMGKLSGLVSLI